MVLASRFSLLSRDYYFSVCGSREVLPNGSRFSLLAPFQRCRAATAPARRLSALRREEETLSHCLALLGSIWSVALAPVLQCCGKPSPTSIRRSRFSTWYFVICVTSFKAKADGFARPVSYSMSPPVDGEP